VTIFPIFKSDEGDFRYVPLAASFYTIDP